MTARGTWLAVLALLVCSQPASADNPQKVAIGPSSTKGALLFNVPPIFATYQLFFIRGDRDGSASNVYWIGIKARPAADGDRFMVETLPPGEYQLDAVYQQSKWVACLETATFQVSIEPGKIAYLGTLDARPALASIQRNASAKEQLRAETFQWHFYRENVAPPRLSGRDAEGLARAEAFVREHMPKSSAATTLASVHWGPPWRSQPSGRADQCN